MEKNKVVKTAQKKRRAAGAITSAIMALVCLICTILPCSAFVYSPTDADIYAMPLDFVFSVEFKEAGIMQYKLAGYMLSPLMGENISSSSVVDHTYNSIETERDDMYSTFYNDYYTRSQALTSDRLLSIYSFVVNQAEYYDSSEQHFTLTANPAVVSLGREFIHLQTHSASDAYYNVFVSFDYKIAGDTTVYHYEEGTNSSNFVALIPTALELGLTSGELIYVYNYIAEVEYFGDPDYIGNERYPELGISSITAEEKNNNSSLFMAENDRLIASQGGGQAPSIDNVWLLNSVASFFNFEIFPGFSLGGVMGIVFAITVLIAVLKFVAGG